MKSYEIKNLKSLLAKELGSEFEILEQNSKTLTPPGEHYGSLMVSLDLVIKRNSVHENVHLVAKFLPASEMLRAAFDTDVTFKKEILAYLDVIPAFRKLQLDHGVGEEKLLDVFPKCYGARINLDDNQNTVGEDAVLIFENLKVQGYVMYNRFEGFDFETTDLIVKDLAQFHGVGLAMKLLKPQEFQEVVGPCLVRNRGFDDAPQELIDALDHSVISVCESIPEVSQYAQRLANVYKKSREEFNAEKTPRHHWGSLIHGDYWGNNTMVKFNKSGSPIKNKILDMQITEYNSVVRDLLFFLFTSVDNEVLSKSYEDFLKSYHEQLLETLSDFHIDTKPYSWSEFYSEIETEMPKETFHIFFMLKFIFAEKGKVKSLEEFQPSDWTRKDLIGENHREKLKLTVLEFVNRNWI